MSDMYVEDIEGDSVTKDNGKNGRPGKDTQSHKPHSQHVRRARKRRHRPNSHSHSNSTSHSRNHGNGRHFTQPPPSGFAWSQKLVSANGEVNQRKPASPRQNQHGCITVHDPQKMERKSLDSNHGDESRIPTEETISNGLSNGDSESGVSKDKDLSDAKNEKSEMMDIKRSTVNGNVRLSSANNKAPSRNAKVTNSHASRKKAQARSRLSVNNFLHNRGLPQQRKSKAQIVTDYARSIIQKNPDNGKTPNGVAAQPESRNANQNPSSASTNQSRISSAPVHRPHPSPSRSNPRVASASVVNSRRSGPYGQMEETPYQRQLTASHLEHINQARERFSALTPGVQLRYTAPTCVEVETSKVQVSKVETTTTTPTPTYVSGAPSPAANGMVFKRQYANPRILSRSYLSLNDPKKKAVNLTLVKKSENASTTETEANAEEQETLSLKVAQLKRDNAPVKPILKYPEETKKHVRVSSSKSVRFHLPEPKPETNSNPVKELRFLKLY